MLDTVFITRFNQLYDLICTIVENLSIGLEEVIVFFDGTLSQDFVRDFMYDLRVWLVHWNKDHVKRQARRSTLEHYCVWETITL